MRVPLGGLRAGEGRLLVAAGREVALFLTEDGPRAVDARCPHAGGPLHDGMVSGRTVVCPLHMRRVDLDTGEVEDCEQRVRCYSVEVAEDEVRIQLPSPRRGEG